MAGEADVGWRTILPEQLIAEAKKLTPFGNIGVAFRITNR
jgi:hypothetical protein